MQVKWGYAKMTDILQIAASIGIGLGIILGMLIFLAIGLSLLFLFIGFTEKHEDLWYKIKLWMLYIFIGCFVLYIAYLLGDTYFTGGLY